MSDDGPEAPGLRGGLGSPISSCSAKVVLKQAIHRRRNVFDSSCLCIQHFYPEFDADPSTLLSSTIRALVVSAQYPPQLRYILVIIQESGGNHSSSMHYFISNLAPLVTLFFKLFRRSTCTFDELGSWRRKCDRDYEGGTNNGSHLRLLHTFLSAIKTPHRRHPRHSFYASLYALLHFRYHPTPTQM
ncbi:hypothetical protein GYMLUDRAFT_250269 [Collybiopsis luxurians FD-317 M1]|uniref:Unplaced genomic scaffold GYMLUscaffold_79, whole genome shotgun sequence n=1 Tax=Collybiopsis luxurians FD-317 M1 TaxID=944289 RepID=A0A0D0AT25_9AGAR|nr:hypothetical protein GYMLUDRAFT_250269 [Collybiopsis luxurians FD-317 M1]